MTNSQRDKRTPIIVSDCIKIPLGVNAKHGYAVVDKEFLYLNDYKWTLDHGYARGKVNGRLVYIHHLIIGKPKKGLVTDHINRNPLDNRKSNLRIITQKQNCFNSSLRKDNTSNHKGICWDLSRRKWMIRVSNKFIARCNGLSEAVLIRKKAMRGVLYG